MAGFLSSVTEGEESQRKYYFMAGLPRSGSTLLSSILNQNPRFHSGPSSPVLSAMHVLEQHFFNDELYHGYPKPDQAYSAVSNIINHYYEDVEQEVIIDKNRAWVARIPFIQHYIGGPVKVICPVRDIEEILTSMLMMIRRNPYREGQGRINFIDEQLVKLDIPLNDDNRCQYIAGPDGILGQSLNAIVMAMNEGYFANIHFVEYSDLVSKPQETLNAIYEFLGEEPFEHDFDDIENIHRERDSETYGLSDMHYVRPELENTAPDPRTVLSQFVLDGCRGMDYWRQTPFTSSVQTISNYTQTTPNQVNIISPDIEEKGYYEEPQEVTE